MSIVEGLERRKWLDLLREREREREGEGEKCRAREGRVEVERRVERTRAYTYVASELPGLVFWPDFSLLLKCSQRHSQIRLCIPHIPNICISEHIYEGRSSWLFRRTRALPPTIPSLHNSSVLSSVCLSRSWELSYDAGGLIGHNHHSILHRRSLRLCPSLRTAANQVRDQVDRHLHPVS
jgi:hypothetical protein